MSDGAPHRLTNRGRQVGEYFRLERWETPAPPGAEGIAGLEGRAPVDDHQRGAGGGMRTGGLLASLDSLGGFLCGLSVQPEWIVTTSMMATVARLAHRGPLRLRGRMLRRGRNSVVAGVDVNDEGDDDRPVAAATVTCAVLDPGTMPLDFERPISLPMAPLDPDPAELEVFFGIQPATGPRTRLEIAEHLRNPWEILHGGAIAVLADVAACRAVEGRSRGRSVAAADTVLHYLRPIRVGPVEARCQVLGGGVSGGGVSGGWSGRTVVRVAMYDLGSEERLVTFASVSVLDV